jgi:uncharacterized damage-inducible protein DinB
MSLSQQALTELQTAHEYFNRSTRNLTEAQSTFAPAEGTMTAAQQVAHVAHTIDWFVEGASRPEGFDQNWEEQARITARYTSIEKARAWFERAIAAASAMVDSMGDADLLMPMPDGPIMGGAPRIAIFGAICDHTAHHRGALTVYARLNGIVPPMPYMDM